jgi:hypothetical protein
MKRIITGGLLFAIIFFTAAHISVAQNNDPVDRFKEQVNFVVQKVKEAETPKKKRAFLNSSLNKFLTSFERVENMNVLSETDQAALNSLKNNITEKKNELNGLNGFNRIPDNQLNNFANFVQQDLEQADSTVTLSVTVLLLIVIVIILLA